MTKLTSLFSSAALALALVSSASATTVTIGGTAVAGEGMETSVQGATTMTFDGLKALPAGFSAIGTTPAIPLVSGSLYGVYQAPTGDTSTYLTTGAGAIVDLALAPGTTYFGFYWGSADTNNDFQIDESNGSILNINGTQLGALTGAAINRSNSYFVNFYADPGTTFTSAGFSSTQDSFELDNIATATPEPASIATLAGGLLIVAGAIRRRKA
jgi:hypothetical protein